MRDSQTPKDGRTQIARPAHTKTKAAQKNAKPRADTAARHKWEAIPCLHVQKVARNILSVEASDSAAVLHSPSERIEALVLGVMTIGNSIAMVQRWIATQILT